MTAMFCPRTKYDCNVVLEPSMTAMFCPGTKYDCNVLSWDHVWLQCSVLAAIFHPRTSNNSNVYFRTICAWKQYSVLIIQHLITCDYMHAVACVKRLGSTNQQEFVQIMNLAIPITWVTKLLILVVLWNAFRGVDTQSTWCHVLQLEHWIIVAPGSSAVYTYNKYEGWLHSWSSLQCIFSFRVGMLSSFAPVDIVSNDPSLCLAQKGIPLIAFHLPKW